MSQSLPITRVDRSVLTPNETARFQFTRCLIFVLCLVSIAWPFFGTFYGIVSWVCAFMCPLFANVAWQSRFVSQYPPKSRLTHENRDRPWLMVPTFWLPIVEHIVCWYKRQSKTHSGDSVQPPLVCVESSSSIHRGGNSQIRLLKLQNRVVVALITSCCQVFGVVGFFASLSLFT